MLLVVFDLLFDLIKTISSIFKSYIVSRFLWLIISVEYKQRSTFVSKLVDVVVVSDVLLRAID